MIKPTSVGEAPFDRVAAEAGAGGGWKQRVGGSTGTLVEPILRDGPGRWDQRGPPLKAGEGHSPGASLTGSSPAHNCGHGNDHDGSRCWRRQCCSYTGSCFLTRLSVAGVGWTETPGKAHCWLAARQPMPVVDDDPVHAVCQQAEERHTQQRTPSMYQPDPALATAWAPPPVTHPLESTQMTSRLRAFPGGAESIHVGTPSRSRSLTSSWHSPRWGSRRRWPVAWRQP